MTSYDRGRKLENKVVNRFKVKGIYAVRTAGSHSIFDVIAIDLQERKIYLKQLKKGYITPKECKEVLNEIFKFAGTFVVIPSLEISHKRKIRILE